MSNPLGPAAFFTLEAGECLDRLERIFSTPQGPLPEELIRTARALRGSALMANQPPLARAADWPLCVIEAQRPATSRLLVRSGSSIR